MRKLGKEGKIMRKRQNRVLGLVLLLMIMFAAIGFGSRAEAASRFKIRINKQQNCVTVYELNEKGKYKR